MAAENTSLPLLVASAARTTDHVGAWQVNEDFAGAHFLVNVTAAAGTTASFKVSIEGRVPGTTKSYDVLVSSAISSTGVTALKVYPGITASANAAASDILPYEWRVTSTHAGAQSLTYSVGVGLAL